MKVIVTCLLIAFAWNSPGLAQIDNSDIDIAQSLFGKTKRMIILEYIQLDSGKQQQFWKVYEQYEEKRKAIEKERFMLLKEYAENYATLDSTEANKIIIGFMKSSDEYNSLYKVYHKKVERIIGGLKAATFIQLEIFLQTSVQSELQSQIPVIGELERLNDKKTETKKENLKG